MSKEIKIKVKKPKARNAIAVLAWQHSGSGFHTPKKYNRKVKHKNRKDW